MAETDKHPLVSSEVGTAADDPAHADPSAENNREANLRTLVGQYEARLDEVAELVARVRHEINNPLTGVLGQAQLLLREELPESVRLRATKIEGLAIRIRDIVAELRQVQKTSKS